MKRKSHLFINTLQKLVKKTNFFTIPFLGAAAKRLIGWGRRPLVILMIFVFFLSFSCIDAPRDLPQPGQTFKGKYDVDVTQHFAQGSRGIIVGTRSPAAVNAGMEILKEGGSAADAALATSMAQIVFDVGALTSFAGIMSVVYYDARTGKVYSMNACFKTVQQEDDPLTIPREGVPSGRAVLVPGFMAGVQALHDRFGKLPFARIFEPAIYYAENGIYLSSGFVSLIRQKWNVLSRLPETRKIFLKDNGLYHRFYRAGELFKQPELVKTLRKVIANGADYMYTGAWAEKFVDLVRQDGGKMTMRDLADYKVAWADPLFTSHYDYDVYALCPPSFGSSAIIEGLNLIECADLRNMAHYTASAEALYRLIKAARVGALFRSVPYSPEIVKSHIPEGDFSYESRQKKETAQLIWEKIMSGEWDAIERDTFARGFRNPGYSGHSAAVVAVDEEGSVAAICHTFNQNSWGSVGIFVNGVSISDAANFQTIRIYRTGPGNHLPDTTNPCMVLKNGIPVFASSCIGSDLHEATLQNVHNFLNHNMTPEDTVKTAKFVSCDWGNFKQRILNNSFSQEILEALKNRGQDYVIVNSTSYIWMGVLIDPQAGILHAGVTRSGSCHAQGY